MDCQMEPLMVALKVEMMVNQMDYFMVGMTAYLMVCLMVAQTVEMMVHQMAHLTAHICSIL